jgi:LCP family protein required for cell wall assembly
MSHPQEPHARHRSAFAAAFLSLIFPGLGHAYAGAYQRAIGFAAAPVLLLALGAGIGLRANIFDLAGVALEYLWLIQILNILILLYRIVAAVDAYRVANYLNASDATEGRRLGRARTAINPLSIAGLAAVVVVMSGVHVVVAQYDLQAQDLVNCVFDPNGTAQCDADTSPSASNSPDQTDSGDTGVPTASLPGGTENPGATAVAAPSTAPYTGGRLNILLIGADQRPHQGTFNTDTLIVASIDPTTKQVAMFSLPRDTTGVPLPPGPARAALGTYYPAKINSLWTEAQHRPDLFPGNNAQRGYRALKDTLGYLYGISIPYYAEVNFDGFEKLVDAVGGVTINVQFPVLDDYFPGDNGSHLRVYIPAGIQHMSGAQALIYARSRHGSIDYDRSQRQQRVLLSLKDQTDVNAMIPKIPTLIQALKSTVHTDIPVDKLPALLQLGGSVDTANIRSYVFSPPLYGAPVVGPYGDANTIRVAKVRAAVTSAFSAHPADEAQRETIADEGASVWVLNGSGKTGQASNIAAYLEYRGVNASAPTQRPPSAPAATKIVVYNGAENDDPATIALLQAIFGVTATPVSDPTAKADIVITTAKSTPNLAPPAGP